MSAKQLCIILITLFALAAALTGTVAATNAEADARHSATQNTIQPPLDTPIVTATPTCLPAWNLILSPTINLDLPEALFQAADAAASNDVWAVGYYITETRDLHAAPPRREWRQLHDSHAKQDDTERYAERALVGHWNGSQWADVPSGDVGDDDNVLYGVDALAPNDVWAAGYYVNPYGVAQTLVKHWNGTQWAVVPSPNSGPLQDNQFFAIEAVAPNDVWAVGAYSNDTPVFQTLAAHWDGAAWSIVPSPNGGDGSNYLSGLAVISANDIWAVGSYFVTNGDYGVRRALTLHWNGTQWSMVQNPGVGSGSNLLYGVSAVAANDVWAVGIFYSYHGGSRGLIEHWDGTAWNVVLSPGTDSNYSELRAVTTISADDVWAVGSADNGYYRNKPLIEHWNGTEWRVVRNANPPFVRYSELDAVTAASPGDVWALGAYQDVGSPGYEVLVEHYGTECVPAACQISFTDVHPSDYYYFPVRYLYCHGAVSGYGDNTFRPGNTTTRAQLCKLLVLAEGWPVGDPQDYHPHFSDVAVWDPFFVFIEEAYEHEVISGYADGTFRPGNSVTRGQLCKIIVLAQEWPVDTSGGPHFTDVPTNHSLYNYVETLYNHHAIAGYADGTFHPGNSATRGQIAKIVFQALTQP